MSNYWQDRAQAAQDNLTNKKTKEIEKQIAKYYKRAMEQVIEDFIYTYEKAVNAEVFQDRKPTPADLYKLDSYWKMQASLKQELQKLGDKQALLLAKEFEKEFTEIYKLVALQSQMPYTTPAKEMVTQMVNQIWAADGKAWSARIWQNIEQLTDTLNEELLHCVVAGKNSDDLKVLLVDRFNVSYNRADTLVRTELAHIQTQAAQQRYLDAGVKEVQVWASEDERRCKVCGKLHEKKYPIGAQMPIPAHPKCRCCIVPVIE